jgi:hypothetical protein
LIRAGLPPSFYRCLDTPVNLCADIPLTALKGVEPRNPVLKGRVKQNNLSLGFDVAEPAQDVLVEEAVRVNKTETLSASDHLPRNPLNELGFPCAGSPNAVNVGF